MQNIKHDEIICKAFLAAADSENEREFTPFELCYLLCNKLITLNYILKNTRILILCNIEFILTLSNLNIDLNNVYFVTQNNTDFIYVSRLLKVDNVILLKYSNINNLETMKKFDIIIGNPPYNTPKTKTKSSNTGKLYMQFLITALKCSDVVAFITPAKDTNNPKSTFNKILTGGGLRLCYDTTTYFNIAYSTCCFIIDRTYTGMTDIKNTKGDKIAYNILPGDIIPLQETTIVKFSKDVKMLSSMWQRSTVYRNDSRIGSKGIKMADSVGYRNEDVVYVDIAALPTDFKCYSQWKVIIPNVGDYDNIGNVKVCPPNTGTSYGIVCFGVDTEQHAKQLKVYLESDFVKQIVKSIKITTPNSKSLFNNIPVPDFTDQIIHTI
jgi:hypothetical protein